MFRKSLQYEQFLVARLNSGDSDAFSEIFNAYYKDLVLFAFSNIKDMANSEEIVQDIFVKLWEDREKMDIRTTLKCVLLKSTQNRCIDWHRHQKIINKHNDYIINHNHIFDNDCDSYLLWSELNSSVESAMNKMPETLRKAFEMNRNEGLKYQEIADNLSVSLRTVEARISKALEFLRSELREFL
jgi:RNA polymerase sigma-70 factor (ECF subfamily)